MEGNKLIYIFLTDGQVEPEADGRFDCWGRKELNDVFSDIAADDTDAQHFFTPAEMKFHENWEWLMPVVEKIEYIESEKTGNRFQVMILEEEVSIFDKEDFTEERGYRNVINVPVEGESKRTNVYKAVVKFVEWYRSEQLSTNTKDELRTEVGAQLEMLYRRIGIDKPSNHEEIVDYCTEDVVVAADKYFWNSEDVNIAFRRFIEQTKTID